MSSVVPFEKCIARPPASMLKEHLINVKDSMESIFKDYYNEELVQLIGLSGVCHDLAKSNAEWQKYIKNKNIKKGPTHSPCGAFFFSYLGYCLLEKKNIWDKYSIYWLWLARDIADHHGNLGSLSDDSWLKRYLWDMYDLKGIEEFIKTQYNELSELQFNEKVLENWLDIGDEKIEEVLDLLDLGYEQWEPLTLMNRLQEWRMLTTSLIAGDRFDVKSIQTKWLDKHKNTEYCCNIDEYCRKNQGHPLSTVRMEAQRSIMQQLTRYPNYSFYTLSMPTGYGKTITALKIAAWFGKNQGYKKIVYVAPYLSILEQTSHVIEEVMKELVLEHHSLAVLDSDDNQRAEINQLAMESWAHSIVCTSFNQFGKAIFPKRAQETLRRTFLRDSVIIIDEPQIFSPDVWNLFLCGLESISLLLNMKVIFLSATMPSFQYGLSKEPAKLEVKSNPTYDRYSLHIEEQKDEVSLANFLQKNERLSQAAILNTIEDAYRVYKNIENEHVYLLHGLMTPLHKQIIIEKIGEHLKNGKTPLYLVSTQVIEAGVDVSFQHVARALPILPSIVQAAGRVNRHNEGEKKGVISVFPFYRSGEKDTRTYIYPKSLQQITDKLLYKKEIWTESELTGLVQRYYEEMFRQNTYETALAYIKEAYQGNWQQLSDFQPFEQDYLRLPIFIPWDPNEDEKKYLHGKFAFLQRKFNVSNSHEVYERYSDIKYMSNLSFDDRKQFMILFHYYILNLPVKKALQVVGKDDFLNHKIPILIDTDAYDQKIGLTSPFEEYDNIL